MPRNRIVYAQEALFASNSPATGDLSSITQIHRVQSANYSYNITRTDINQYGQYGRIGSIILEPPTVSLDFTYLLTNVNNEQALGFTVNQNTTCISGFLSNAEDERNYFITLSPKGTDDIGQTNNAVRNVYGFGNGFITSYTSEGAVGAVPTVSVNVEASNFKAYISGSNQATPAINPVDGSSIVGPTFTIPTAVTGYASQAVALRPGDIVLDISAVDSIGFDPVDLKVQSYSLNIPLSRENLQRLGNDFAFAKELTVPIVTTLSVEALAGDIKTGSLNNILCNDKEYDLTIKLYRPACPPAVGSLAVQYTLKKAKLDGVDASSSIGPAKTVTLNFSSQVSGPQDTTRGVYISGVLDS